MIELIKKIENNFEELSSEIFSIWESHELIHENFVVLRCAKYDLSLEYQTHSPPRYMCFDIRHLNIESIAINDRGALTLRFNNNCYEYYLNLKLFLETTKYFKTEDEALLFIKLTEGL